MIQFILDTDHISLYQRQNLLVCNRVNAVPSLQIGVTIVSFEEQVAGRFVQIQRARNLLELVSAYGLLQGALDYFIKQQVLPFYHLMRHQPFIFNSFSNNAFVLAPKICALPPSPWPIVAP